MWEGCGGEQGSDGNCNLRSLLFGDESNCEARALRAATEPFRAIKSVFAAEVLSYLLMTAQGQRVQAGATIPGIDQHLTMVD